VTDRRTDGQTELRWLRRAIAVPAVARKKQLDGFRGFMHFKLQELALLDIAHVKLK